MTQNKLPTTKDQYFLVYPSFAYISVNQHILLVIQRRAQFGFIPSNFNEVETKHIIIRHLRFKLMYFLRKLPLKKLPAGWISCYQQQQIRFFMFLQLAWLEKVSVKLRITGMGYVIEYLNKIHNLVLQLGFSHQIYFQLPSTFHIGFHGKKNRVIRMTGNPRFLVFQTALKIRATKLLDVYRGKGVRFKKERFLRKAGKKKFG